ncbi:hypothetical protein [Noviherbaspirillum sp.]|uniref:hypothetical protein n=1 Tax=Noviherbaspirillum sp. TaxID=1926288 RepID=UPI002FE248CF
MQINRLVEEALGESAVELLNVLAAHVLAAGDANRTGMQSLPVEPDDWNTTMFLMREIFEAEILVSGDDEWVSFRILQSFGVNHGRLAFQFTPTFAQALSG